MLKKRLNTIITFVTIITFNVFAAYSQDRTLQKIDSLFEGFNKSPSPGQAILVVKDGKVLFNKGYGMANLEYNIPISSSTVFDIASLSKQFTGFAIATLEEQGKISMEDDIRKYLPELNDFGHRITVGHLIHHTSGLRDWASSFPLAAWDFEDIITYEQIINFVFNQQELNFKPGTAYSYSNTGYVLLAEIIKRITGKTLNEWTADNIFIPLGMKDTRINEGKHEIIKNLAYSYQKQNEKYSPINNGLSAPGSSSVMTTIDDLAKWYIYMDRPKTEFKPIFERMFQAEKLSNDSAISYAYGVSNTQYLGMKEINHSGSWANFKSFFSYFPNQHLTIVVLQNIPNDANKIVHDIADLFLPNMGKTLHTLKRPTIEPKFFDVTQLTLNQYLGKYQLGPGWYVTISKHEKNLQICSTGETVVPLKATSDSTFWAYNSSFSFYKNNEAGIAGLYFREMTCPKLKPFTSPLNEYEGEYYSEELQTFFVIQTEHDKLILKNLKAENLKLSAVRRDEFEGNEWYIRTVDFYRDANDKIMGFYVNSSRSRKQSFVKR